MTLVLMVLTFCLKMEMIVVAAAEPRSRVGGVVLSGDFTISIIK